MMLRLYEHMKLRMLNGAHSLIAYLGHLHDCKYVRDAMANADISQLVKRHFGVAANTLSPLEGVDFSHYADELTQRFENRNIAHETYQIAMDGTQKLPQRIFAPAVDALNANQTLDSFALATAAWMQYCYIGINGHSVKNIAAYPLRDPRDTEIADALNGVAQNADEIQKRLNGLSDFVPVELLNSDVWQRLVALNLRHLLADELALIVEHARS